MQKIELRMQNDARMIILMEKCQSRGGYKGLAWMGC